MSPLGAAFFSAAISSRDTLIFRNCSRTSRGAFFGRPIFGFLAIQLVSVMSFRAPNNFVDFSWARYFLLVIVPTKSMFAIERATFARHLSFL